MVAPGGALVVVIGEQLIPFAGGDEGAAICFCLRLLAIHRGCTCRARAQDLTRVSVHASTSNNSSAASAVSGPQVFIGTSLTDSETRYCPIRRPFSYAKLQKWTERDSELRRSRGAEHLLGGNAPSGRAARRIGTSVVFDTAQYR